MGKTRPKHVNKTKSHDFKVEIGIKGALITATTDRDAQVNILPKSIATQLNLPIQHSRLKICPFRSKPYSVTGKYEGSVTYGTVIISSTWYIINKKGTEPLLSGSTAEKLGIITFTPQKSASINEIKINTDSTNPTKLHYLQHYSQAFNGIGTLKNYEVKLHIDSTVKPVAEHPRTIPYHLQHIFNMELESMERQGIIEEHYGLAPWISNIVLAPKDNGGIRVTIDMRQVNKTIQSTNIPIPKVEDIKAKLAGSRVFSKFVFKSAFHQLTLNRCK